MAEDLIARDSYSAWRHNKQPRHCPERIALRGFRRTTCVQPLHLRLEINGVMHSE